MVYTGAAAMFLISKRLKKRHNLSDDVRAHMYSACKKWVKSINVKNGQFNGGKSPNLADLAVYGALNSFEGCQTFNDVLENTKIGNLILNNLLNYLYNSMISYGYYFRTLV